MQICIEICRLVHVSTFLGIRPTMVTVFLILTPRPKDALFSFMMFCRSALDAVIRV